LRRPGLVASGEIVAPVCNGDVAVRGISSPSRFFVLISKFLSFPSHSQIAATHKLRGVENVGPMPFFWSTSSLRDIVARHFVLSRQQR